jgi:citrate synthase
MSGITLTNEQFQQLLNIQQPRHENGNFSTCTNRFAGGTDEDVYAFIEAVYRLTAVE